MQCSISRHQELPASGCGTSHSSGACHLETPRLACRHINSVMRAVVGRAIVQSSSSTRATPCATIRTQDRVHVRLLSSWRSVSRPSYAESLRCHIKLASDRLYCDPVTWVTSHVHIMCRLQTPMLARPSRTTCVPLITPRRRHTMRPGSGSPAAYVWKLNAADLASR